jgi:OmpA-OmpF porin, OOP family
MSKTASARAAALVLSTTLALGLTTAIAADFEESYWYASGDPTVPDGQLWVNSAGECWQSAYPDGPTNLPPCVAAVVPEEFTLRLNFEFDKYVVPDNVVNPDELARLDQYIADVKATPADEYLTVVGHTDIKGSEAYNYTLGMNRATSVRDYMIREGISPDRIAPPESRGKLDMLPDFAPDSVFQRRVVIRSQVD